MRLIKWLGEKWLRSKIRDERKKGNSVLKFIDGKKSFLFVVAFLIAGVIQGITGHDVSGLVDTFLRAMDWSDPEAIARAKDVSTRLVPLAIAAWAAISAGWKMRQQYKAGATIGELAQPVGIVKAAAADGTLEVLGPKHVVLQISDVNVVASPTRPSPGPVVEPRPPAPTGSGGK